MEFIDSINREQAKREQKVDEAMTRLREKISRQKCYSSLKKKPVPIDSNTSDCVNPDTVAAIVNLGFKNDVNHVSDNENLCFSPKLNRLTKRNKNTTTSNNIDAITTISPTTKI